MASTRERVSKSGERTWAVLFREHGKQSSETFHDPKAAQKFKTLVEVLGPEKARAEMMPSGAGGLTVDDLAAQFFAWKEPNVTPRTIADYRRDYANWIKPTLGHRQAEAVDERDVQQLVDTMTARNLDPKSVADRHMILHSIYKFGSARSRRLVEHNPCLETQMPRRKKKPPKGVTVGEYQALYSAASRVAPDAADLIMFIASTGWRWSEAAALAVRGVEEQHEAEGLVMYATLNQVMRLDGQNRRVIATDSAKSFASFRRTKIPTRTAVMIRRRMVGKGLDDLVFTNSAGRKWYQQNFLSRTWTAIVEESGLERRPTPHALRHTHIGRLDSVGATLPQMKGRAGHESINTTVNTYGGMVDDISLRQLDALVDGLHGPEQVEGIVVLGEVESGALGIEPRSD